MIKTRINIICAIIGIILLGLMTEFTFQLAVWGVIYFVTYCIWDIIVYLIKNRKSKKVKNSDQEISQN